MVDKILQAAGFVENKTYRQTFFIAPPKETYVVYNDSIERHGGDLFNKGYQHDVTFELYSYKPDPEKEKDIEKQLDTFNLKWTKQDRYRIVDEGLYQVIYEFDYFDKGGN